MDINDLWALFDQLNQARATAMLIDSPKYQHLAATINNVLGGIQSDITKEEASQCLTQASTKRERLSYLSQEGTASKSERLSNRLEK